MKNFFKTIKSSIYSPDFYKLLENQTTTWSFKYFVKLNLLLALIMTIGLSFIIVPSVIFITKQSNIDSILQVFPKDLEITIKNGQASSNKTGSYSILAPIIPANEQKILDKKGINTSNFKNLVTIDTSSDFSLEKYKASESLFYLSKDYLVYQGNSSQIKVQTLKGINDLTISQTNIKNWIAKVLPYIKVFLPIAVLCLFIVFFFISLISNLIFVLIISLIVLVIEKIRKININYKTIFKRGLHIVTAIMILDLILFIFGFNSIWIVNIALFIWLYYSNNKVVATN